MQFNGTPISDSCPEELNDDNSTNKTRFVLEQPFCIIGHPYYWKLFFFVVLLPSTPLNNA